MEQQKMYIAFYDKTDGYSECQEYIVKSVDDDGIIELGDCSVVYSNELDVVHDEGGYFVCCSYDKKAALHNVAKMAYEFFAKCIADIARNFDI